jgi:hypothetical protein
VIDAPSVRPCDPYVTVRMAPRALSRDRYKSDSEDDYDGGKSSESEDMGGAVAGGEWRTRVLARAVDHMCSRSHVQ